MEFWHIINVDLEEETAKSDLIDLVNTFHVQLKLSLISITLMAPHNIYKIEEKILISWNVKCWMKSHKFEQGN